MFPFLTIIFIIFTLGYVGFTFLVRYHLRRFTLSSHPMPRVYMGMFLICSSALWLAALSLLISLRLSL